jgi:hypothetical protein
MQTTHFAAGLGNKLNDDSFDLFRLSTAKQTVDVSPNTLRAYHKLGLPFYRRGKVVFVSRRELNDFIREGEAANPKTENSANSTEEATETQMDADGLRPAASGSPALTMKPITALGERLLKESVQWSPRVLARCKKPTEAPAALVTE